MSSRGGPRASGTDGSDFSHRERVASHYRESVRQKIKVKVCIWIHLFFVTCVITWFGLSYTRNVQLTPEPWIMAWCISFIPALIGLQSLPKNRSNLLYMFAFGIIVTGVGPLMYGSTFVILEVLQNMSEGIVPATQDWRILPIKMAVVAFIIQLHAITVYYSSKLISAWRAKGEKGS
ncbi:protein jagunal homolog 1 [Exaiptasia diaphana]|uniref:Uncharacterized protein n=1 Tax=Exaiptasia diaphana TaxID=2652724 RepID=A0A913X8Q1_EXADI|nr:protein jagunal homolog 1 [Exaiptasia diaphana]KXJ14046.1 Protein jagunal-like 1 [Exaiptasia diaphana]